MASNHNNELPEGFKGTELGPLPEEWYVARLREVASKLKAGGTPSTAEARYWNGNIYFAKVADVARQSKYLIDTAFRITEEGLSHSSAWLVPRGAILLSMYGTAGETTITKKPTAISQNVLGIVPNERVLAEFLYYVLAYAKTETLHLVTDTTIFKHFTLEKAKQIMFPLPTLHEQRAIAWVLSTIQQAVEVQDKITVAVRELKKSLMRHLFTYGPVPPSEAERVPLKETEIGLIPEHWAVRRLVDIATLQRGKDLPKQNQVAGQYPIIGSSGIMGYHNKYVCVGQGVVTGRSGSIGKLSYVEEKYWPHNTGLYVKDFHGNNPKFIYYLLHLLDFRKYATGVSVPTLNRNFIHSALLPLPPLPKQQEIARILSSVDKKIATEEKQKTALQALFKTMLHLLMTGEVRVKELEAPVA